MRSCRAELLQENYFQVVLEAAKSIAQKLRDRTGLASGRGGACRRRPGLGKARHAVSCLQHLEDGLGNFRENGLLSLIKGLFGTFRNPTAHAPKISWNMTEPDALDLLTMASFIHRRLDSAARTPRQM